MHLFLHALAEVGILRVLLLRIYFYCDNMSYKQTIFYAQQKLIPVIIKKKKILSHASAGSAGSHLFDLWSKVT